MKRVKLLAATLALVMAVVGIAAGAGQTQAPEGSDPPLQPPGTGPSGQEGAPPLPAGPTEGERAGAVLDLSAYAFWSINGGALKPRVSDVEWHIGGGGGCTYASSGDFYTWWSTPVYLPHGATLRYFRMYYNDQNFSVDCEAYLTAYDLYGDIVDEWGVSSSGTGMSYATTDELDHVVDYNSYSYVINWQPNDSGDDMQVCGFKVYYERP
jgi:hypothetical protein